MDAGTDIDLISPGWVSRRAAALARLQRFVPQAGRAYAASRNFDFGPGDRSNVSALSPWIRHRLILEEEVLGATLQRHSFAAAEKFVQEVFWRGYFKGWLEHRPQVWTRYRADLLAGLEDLERDAGLRDRYEAAVGGRSGIDCFDAWAQELVATGYLHNHTRMWFASIWIFTLRLPWQLGADFFLRHLLDGDPASNTLGWRWVAGLHTKGKTYLARASNIARYTEGRFDPAGQLATAAPALSESAVDAPLPPQFDAVPRDPGRFGLLVTEEDGQPESLDLPGRPSALLGLAATAARSPMATSEGASSFAAGAVADALSRGAEAFGSEAAGADGLQAQAEDWGAGLVHWARSHDLSVIVTAAPAVGPVRDCLTAARPVLADAGITLLPVTRRYDRAVWPYAAKRFFQLKARIPKLLQNLDLNS
ncbi:FAD-binding domain-containing protein [Pelagibius sp.]|uniref:FAD-binding domain-containing protein n=1 Tax=Pelagibius sp. TaxID=1931238 RepID=UPI00261E0D53|nr:FAD-binding domain-containing protein [Pelagibius sp.]